MRVKSDLEIEIKRGVGGPLYQISEKFLSIIFFTKVVLYDARTFKKKIESKLPHAGGGV